MDRASSASIQIVGVSSPGQNLTYSLKDGIWIVTSEKSNLQGASLDNNVRQMLTNCAHCIE